MNIEQWKLTWKRIFLNNFIFILFKNYFLKVEIMVRQTVSSVFPKGKDLYLTIRKEDGKTYNMIYQNFKPYFYATNSNLEPIVDKSELFYVEAEHPGKIHELKSTFQYAYEANVLYDARFLIDKGESLIDPSVQWNVTWIDIETRIDEQPIEAIKKGATEITVITKIDSLFNRLVCFACIDYDESKLKEHLNHAFNLAIIKLVIKQYIKQLEDQLQNDLNLGLEIDRLNKVLDELTSLQIKNDDEIKTFIKNTCNISNEQIDSLLTSAKESLKSILNLQIEIKKYDNEKEMLKAFAEDLIKYQPDVLTGWNVHFDYYVIYNRMKQYKMLKLLSPSFIGQYDGKSYNPSPRVDEIELQGGKTIYRYHTPGYYVIDYLEVYQKRRFKVEKSYSLDYITRAWDIEIPKFRHGYSNLDDLLKNEPTTYIYYNIIDVISLYLLERKTNYMDITISVCNFTKCPMSYCTSQRMLVDCTLIGWLNRRQLVRITKGQRQNVSYEGAYVYADIGFHKGWIADADFTSLYPSIIRTCNISPETYVGTLDELGLTKEEAMKKYIVCPNGACFKKKSEQPGILPTILDELFNNRKKAKKQAKEYLNKYKETGDTKYYELYKQYDNLQFTLKILLNSFYGVFGDAAYDLCTPEIAGAITATGRFLIKFAKQKLEERGFKVIYIDTDSNYVLLRPVESDIPEEQICECISQIIEIYDYINSQWGDLVVKEFGVNTEHYFEMKSELLAKNMIVSKKKRYAMSLILSESQLDVLRELHPDKNKMIEFLKSTTINPNIEVKGLEVVRSDVSDALVEEMYNMLNELLLEKKSPSQIRRSLQELFVKMRRLAARDLSKVAIPCRLNSWVDKNGNPITNAKALAIKEYNEQHNDSPILLGEKCLMVYTKDVIGAKVWKKGERANVPLHEIDWKKMFKSLLEKKAEIWYDLLTSCKK